MLTPQREEMLISSNANDERILFDCTPKGKTLCTHSQKQGCSDVTSIQSAMRGHSTSASACSHTRTLLPIHLGQLTNAAVLFPVVCLLAATTHSNLIFNLRRSTLTADAWRTSSGDCIDWQVGDYPTLLIWLVSLSALLNKLVFWEFTLDMFGITKLKIPYQYFQCFFQPATLSSYTCVTSGYNFLERKILHHISSFFYVSPLSKCGLPAQHQTADKNC